MAVRRRGRRRLLRRAGAAEQQARHRRAARSAAAAGAAPAARRARRRVHRCRPRLDPAHPSLAHERALARLSDRPSPRAAPRPRRARRAPRPAHITRTSAPSQRSCAEPLRPPAWWRRRSARACGTGPCRRPTACARASLRRFPAPPRLAVARAAAAAAAGAFAPHPGERAARQLQRRDRRPALALLEDEAPGVEARAVEAAARVVEHREEHPSLARVHLGPVRDRGQLGHPPRTAASRAAGSGRSRAAAWPRPACRAAVAATARGAATRCWRARRRAAPRGSVTRTPTLQPPGRREAAPRRGRFSPPSSSNDPSPSRSNANRSASPSGSLEAPASNVTGAPAAARGRRRERGGRGGVGGEPRDHGPVAGGSCRPRRAIHRLLARGRAAARWRQARPRVSASRLGCVEGAGRREPCGLQARVARSGAAGDDRAAAWPGRDSLADRQAAGLPHGRTGRRHRGAMARVEGPVGVQALQHALRAVRERPGGEESRTQRSGAEEAAAAGERRRVGDREPARAVEAGIQRAGAREAGHRGLGGLRTPRAGEATPVSVTAPAASTASAAARAGDAGTEVGEYETISRCRLR